MINFNVDGIKELLLFPTFRTTTGTINYFIRQKYHYVDSFIDHL